MADDAARVRRLRRLEKLRAMAKQASALEAAQAESALARIEALAARTGAMVEDYRSRSVGDGLELRQLREFVSGLGNVSAATGRDAAQARSLADLRQQELALAERRRAAVEDRVRAGVQALAQRGHRPVLAGRRQSGTGLE